MGCRATVLVVGGPADLVATVAERVRSLEQRWSRFVASSDISAANARPGVPVAAAPESVELVRRSALARIITGGLFDPTLLDRQLAIGDVASRGDPTLRTPPPGEAIDGSLAWDDVAGTITVGRGFDPGGIGKGLAADLAVTFALENGAAGCLVEIGGDLRAAGHPPAGDAWSVGVERPGQPAGLLQVLWIAEGGVATSVPEARVVVDDAGVARHHLLDPRTGRPAETDVRSATVLSGAGWIAEALAKAVVLAGRADGMALVHRTGAEALVLDHEGVVHTTPGLERFRS
jgi:thiamine biosynthesis lipoprotein